MACKGWAWIELCIKRFLETPPPTVWEPHSIESLAPMTWLPFKIIAQEAANMSRQNRGGEPAYINRPHYSLWRAYAPPSLISSLLSGGMTCFLGRTVTCHKQQSFLLFWCDSRPCLPVKLQLVPLQTLTDPRTCEDTCQMICLPDSYCNCRICSSSL
jgi:hypothetical protein